MAIIKVLLIGIVISGFFGFGALIVGGAQVVDDIVDDWGGRGGCGGGSFSIGENENRFSHCHNDSYSESEDGYCSYHDEYLSEEEWEDHREDCPMDG